MCISPTVRYEDQGNVWGKKKYKIALRSDLCECNFGTLLGDSASIILGFLQINFILQVMCNLT